MIPVCWAVSCRSCVFAVCNLFFTSRYADHVIQFFMRLLTSWLYADTSRLWYMYLRGFPVYLIISILECEHEQIIIKSLKVQLGYHPIVTPLTWDTARCLWCGYASRFSETKYTVPI